MALRLTADARLQFCLLREDIAVDLAPHMAAGDGHLERAVGEALSIYETASMKTSEEQHG